MKFLICEDANDHKLLINLQNIQWVKAKKLGEGEPKAMIKLAGVPKMTLKHSFDEFVATVDKVARN